DDRRQLSRAREHRLRRGEKARQVLGRRKRGRDAEAVLPEALVERIRPEQDSVPAESCRDGGERVLGAGPAEGARLGASSAAASVQHRGRCRDRPQAGEAQAHRALPPSSRKSHTSSTIRAPVTASTVSLAGGASDNIVQVSVTARSPRRSYHVSPCAL